MAWGRRPTKSSLSHPPHSHVNQTNGPSLGADSKDHLDLGIACMAFRPWCAATPPQGMHAIHYLVPQRCSRILIPAGPHDRPRRGDELVSSVVGRSCAEKCETASLLSPPGRPRMHETVALTGDCAALEIR